ncbi:MAG: ZIP family metal transporter [Bacteroidota bacterium]|nr:ZIP family metal transporter [Bacteroidota bacterium]
MNNLILFGSVAAGVVLGMLLQNQRLILTRLILSFSGAFLFAISILHLVPDLFESGDHNIGFWVLGGFIFQYILDFFSGGVEHGHFHATKNEGLRFGFVTALFLHAFIEGMPLAGNATSNTELLAAIALHKIPISTVLFFGLRQMKVSKGRSILFLSGFAMMAPLGMWAQEYIPLLSDIHNEIKAIVLGIFFHVSTTIWFEATDDHRFNFKKLIAVLAALVVAALTTMMH